MKNLIDSGELRQRVTIQVNTPTQDAFGQPQDSWATLTSRWAKIEPNTGAPYIQADTVRNLTSHRITMRHFAGLTPRHRILFGSRTFNVTGLISSEERNIDTVIACQEVI